LVHRAARRARRHRHLGPRVPPERCRRPDRQGDGLGTPLPGLERQRRGRLVGYKPNRRTQLSLQYGAKYVRETIDGDDYSGFTDLFGLEGRYELTERWDVGLRGSALHSWSAELVDFSSGVSVGCNLVKNIWISAGYNFVGFQDEDFSRADFTAQGPFVKFRLKFDQNSVKDLLKQI
jgi:hypothetical protein